MKEYIISKNIQILAKGADLYGEAILKFGFPPIYALKQLNLVVTAIKATLCCIL